jgi:hypothetical protein
MRAAIRALRDLCDTNAEVAGLCGLTVAQVRDLLSATRVVGDGEGAGPRQAGPFGPEASPATADEMPGQPDGSQPARRP